MSQFRIISIKNVRTGILKNLSWLITEHGFKKDNNQVIPEISKKAITLKSGCGPGEYWMTFIDHDSGKHYSFENLFHTKLSALDEDAKRSLSSTYFGNLGPEENSELYITAKIRAELEFLIAEKPHLFS